MVKAWPCLLELTTCDQGLSRPTEIIPTATLKGLVRVATHRPALEEFFISVDAGGIEQGVPITCLGRNKDQELDFLLSHW